MSPSGGTLLEFQQARAAGGDEDDSQAPGQAVQSIEQRLVELRVLYREFELVADFRKSSCLHGPTVLQVEKNTVPQSEPGWIATLSSLIQARSANE